MADHTESSGTGIKPYRTFFGSMPTLGYPESASSTFAYGDLVQLNQDASTDVHRVEVASSLSTAYLGVAAGNASSNQDDVIPIYVAHQNAEFIGWFKGTLASSITGTYRNFARDTTRAIDYISSSGTGVTVQITEVGLQNIAGGPYNVGDSNGYVAFRFNPDNTAFGASTGS
jgi:hypothetical protein